MKTCLLVLAVLVAGVQLTFADGSSESGESHEAKQRKESCEHLVDEPESSEEVDVTDAPTTPQPGHCICTPQGFRSKCILIEALYNISITLSIEQQAIFVEFIEEIERDILADFKLTNKKKFVKVAYALKKFFKRHYEIEIAIGYEFVSDWGFVVDLESVAIDINSDSAESVIQLDEDDNTELFDAIRNATSGCGCSAEGDTEVFIGEIREILLQVSFKHEKKMTLIFEKLQAFIEKHSDVEALLMGVEIGEFGSLEEFMDVTQVYWRISNLDVVIGGDAASTELMSALEEASGNTSFSLSVRTQIGQLRGKLLAFFESETDVIVRLKYVSAQFHQFKKLASFIVKFVKRTGLGKWGSVYDLIFSAAFYHNHNLCGCEGLTTIAATTEASSQCSSRGSLISIDASNSTVFTKSVNDAYLLWGRTDKANFASYKKRVESAIWGSEFSTVEAKLQQVVTILTGYAPAGSAQDEQVMTIDITGWGKMRQFCDCQSA